MKKLNGFTTSEIMVALAIIGIVAAISINAIFTSALNSKMKAQLDVTQTMLKSVTETVAFSSNGGSAFLNACAIEGDSQCLRDLFEPRLNVIKKCDSVSISDCFKNYTEAQTILGGELQASLFDFFISPAYASITLPAPAGAVLKNGVALSFIHLSNSCSDTRFQQQDCGIIITDVNGNQKPNEVGRDQFAFHLQENGLVPFGSGGDCYGCDSDNKLGCGGAFIQGNDTQAACPVCVAPPDSITPADCPEGYDGDIITTKTYSCPSHFGTPVENSATTNTCTCATQSDRNLPSEVCPYPREGTINYVERWNCVSNIGSWAKTYVSDNCVCPAGQTWNGTTCVCPSGQTWNGTTCVSNICAVGDLISSGCTCQSPMVNSSGHCCPFSQTWNGTTCACPAGKVWNVVSCQYPCANNATLAGCACVSPMVISSSRCCNPGMTWNGVQCACPAGMTWNGTTCASRCTHDALISSGCICQSPDSVVNGRCKLACNNGQLLSTGCVCPSNCMTFSYGTGIICCCTPYNTCIQAYH